MWGFVSLRPIVFDRQSISGELGGYLARYAPVWPGDLRPVRSEPCSFADVQYSLPLVYQPQP